MQGKTPLESLHQVYRYKIPLKNQFYCFQKVNDHLRTIFDRNREEF